jgi:hypothetical protein
MPVCLPGLHAGMGRAGRPPGSHWRPIPGCWRARCWAGRATRATTRGNRRHSGGSAASILLAALQAGRTRLALRLATNAELRTQLIDDGRGDTLDAALCLMQAAWGWQRGAPDYGLPMPVDPLEGWIVTAQPGQAP